MAPVKLNCELPGCEKEMVEAKTNGVIKQLQVRIFLAFYFLMLFSSNMTFDNLTYGGKELASYDPYNYP